MIDIIKAKILKDKGVEIGFTKTNQKTGKKSKTYSEDPESPHSDFIGAMQNLAGHAAILAEYKDAEALTTDPDANKLEFKDFTVTGFSIAHQGEKNEGCTITALRTLRTGKKMMFNTPFINFNDESEDAYAHIEDLLLKIRKVQAEAKEYMSGKYAPEPQQEIEFPDDLGINDKSKTVIKVMPEQGKGFLSQANPEAMERVAEMGLETQTEKPKDKKGNGKKRVAQSANNPSGLTEE